MDPPRSLPSEARATYEYRSAVCSSHLPVRGLASQPKGKRQEGSSPNTSCVESTLCSHHGEGHASRALGLSRCPPDSDMCSDHPPKVECSLRCSSAPEAGPGRPRCHGLAASRKREALIGTRQAPVSAADGRSRPLGPRLDGARDVSGTLGPARPLRLPHGCDGAPWDL